MEIQGKWEGYYEYGLGYSLPHFGERIKMQLSIRGDAEEFEGEIEEEPSEFSVPHTSTLTGFCEESFISFVKTYPISPSIDEEEATDLVEEKGKLEVVYEGALDEKNKAMYGNWTIIESLKDERGMLHEFAIGGIWLLRKVS
ncbi:MAG: hypothetical protein AAF696_13375 [Bacteroidota bacterium]